MEVNHVLLTCLGALSLIGINLLITLSKKVNELAAVIMGLSVKVEHLERAMDEQKDEIKELKK